MMRATGRARAGIGLECESSGGQRHELPPELRPELLAPCRRRVAPGALLLLACIAFLTAGQFPQGGQAASQEDTPAAIAPDHLLRHLRFLASDSLQGRLSGSPGADSAAAYIAREFRSYGLLPAGDDGSYCQWFDFVSGVSPGPNNRLCGLADTDSATWKIDRDFRPLAFSSNTAVEGYVAFAGYGIVAADLGYDDYRDLDVSGKVVFVLRETPDPGNPHSKFNEYSPLRRKAMVARDKGAKAVLFFTGPGTQETDELMALKADASLSDAGLPAVSVTRKVAEWFFEKVGRNARATQAALDSGKTGGGFLVPSVRMRVSTDLVKERSRTANVIGRVPGEAGGDECIVVGAHYDHLGLGASGSLAERPGEVHNGADDNASGTSGVLEMARAFTTSGHRPGRTLLFVAFAGEDRGALGSNYYTQHPSAPLEQTVAMLNMDMIGRLRGDSLAIGGNGTSPAWTELIQKENARSGFHLTLNEDGYGPSDHSSFYAKDIPVLFFFTGAHMDYHKPSDDVEKINVPGLSRVVQFVYRVALDISELPERPGFVRTKPGPEQAASRGFRVYVGTIPDYLAQVEGVRLTGVRAGGPAERAGIKGGDTIVKFGDRTVRNVYDYTFALQEHRPGDEVIVAVLRDGVQVEFAVRLESRQ